jgi:hypothetical protein
MATLRDNALNFYALQSEKPWRTQGLPSEFSR